MENQCLVSLLVAASLGCYINISNGPSPALPPHSREYTILPIVVYFWGIATVDSVSAVTIVLSPSSNLGKEGCIDYHHTSKSKRSGSQCPWRGGCLDLGKT